MKYKIRRDLSIIVVMAFMTSSCSKNEKWYDCSLLEGEWEMYAMMEEGNDWKEMHPNDPRFQLSFFDTDSVNYFQNKATYHANENAGILLVIFDYGEVKDTVKHEVLLLDESELWLRDLTNANFWDMKFNRIEPSSGSFW